MIAHVIQTVYADGIVVGNQAGARILIFVQCDVHDLFVGHTIHLLQIDVIVNDHSVKTGRLGIEWIGSA